MGNNRLWEFFNLPNWSGSLESEHNAVGIHHSDAGFRVAMCHFEGIDAVLRRLLSFS
jgi:hypothetical protein